MRGNTKMALHWRNPLDFWQSVENKLVLATLVALRPLTRKKSNKSCFVVVTIIRPSSIRVVEICLELDTWNLDQNKLLLKTGYNDSKARLGCQWTWQTWSVRACCSIGHTWILVPFLLNGNVPCAIIFMTPLYTLVTMKVKECANSFFASIRS